MSLLPSRPDASPSEDAGPRVIGVDSEDADDVLAALSSSTARQLLAELHDDPAPPSELAEQVDTSLQNVQYHLEKLQSAGAVEVVETAYSEKGREMDVYAPADQPLVIFAGDESEGSTLRSALSRLVGALAALALGSLVVQELFGRTSILPSPTGGDGAAGGSADGGGDGDVSIASEGDGGATGTATETATEETVRAQDTTATATGTPGETQTAVETSTPTEIATQTQTQTETVTQTPTPTETVTETVTETATNATAQSDELVRTTAEAADAAGAAAGLPPGLLFFAGGVVALAIVAVGLTLRS